MLLLELNFVALSNLTKLQHLSHARSNSSPGELANDWLIHLCSVISYLGCAHEGE